VTAVGLIEGVAESTASILRVFAGSISDRTGRRKPLMLFGYGLANLTKPLLALSTAWPQVLAIRFGDRFGKGIRAAPRDALIADRVDAQCATGRSGSIAEWTLPEPRSDRYLPALRWRSPAITPEPFSGSRLYLASRQR